MYSIQTSTDETTLNLQQNTEHTEINEEEKLHQPLFMLKKESAVNSSLLKLTKNWKRRPAYRV